MRSANARENCKYSLIARCLSGSRTALSPQDYFGEKVALFYVFLCHYTTWCAYLAIAGFAMACDVFIEWSVDTMPVDHPGGSDRLGTLQSLRHASAHTTHHRTRCIMVVDQQQPQTRTMRPAP